MFTIDVRKPAPPPPAKPKLQPVTLPLIKQESLPPKIPPPEVMVKREAKDNDDDFDDEVAFQEIEKLDQEEKKLEVLPPDEESDQDSLKTTIQEREERRRLEEFNERLEMRVSISFKNIKRCCKSSKIKMEVDSMCIWNKQREQFFHYGILELDNRDSKDLKSL